MIIQFLCPHCHRELALDDLGEDKSPCPLCGEIIALHITRPMRDQNTVDHCAVCDCPTVYVQKDFNRTLGMAIFVGGAVISLILYGYNRVWSAFGVLLGCAAVDGLLYKILPDVTICYKCYAQYRGVTANPANQGFELGLAEKFDPLDKRPAAENPAAEWHGR